MTSSTRLGLLAVAACWSTALPAQELTLPLKSGSVRFAAIGDVGTGDKSQYDVANELTKYHAIFPFPFVIMLGDNIYGAERPQDFVNKFEKPYKALLDAKVEFDAALGNHDDPNQRFYKPYNFGGERYRTFKKGNVRFFVIDSNYLDPDQVKWLEKELSASQSEWKIAYFHHPLYTTARRGPEIELRSILEPLFVKYGVDAVFTGHEHIYERMKPEKGIHYFITGGAAKLNAGDVHPGGAISDVGFATDRSFMLVEIVGNTLYWQAVGRTGQLVDKGSFTRGGVNIAAGSAPIIPAKKPGTTAKKPVTPVKKPATTIPASPKPPTL